MNFQILDRMELSDGSLRYHLYIPSSELIFVGYILESFEGWCYYTNRKDKDNLLQIEIPADYQDSVKELLDFLSNWDYRLSRKLKEDIL
ncbi:MAG: hypothetical protein JW996_01975 [Candidatus Cloacimonetes bacterium]|nr:hypothetical protein [Candidatus Cloacimonadota bacterium]